MKQDLCVLSRELSLSLEREPVFHVDTVGALERERERQGARLLSSPSREREHPDHYWVLVP